jgi:hypothetical protein
VRAEAAAEPRALRAKASSALTSKAAGLKLTARTPKKNEPELKTESSDDAEQSASNEEACYDATSSEHDAKETSTDAAAKKQKTDKASQIQRNVKYHFYSIGRQQNYSSTLQTLEDEHNFDMRRTVVVNVECIPNVGHDEPCKEHTGHHEHIWARIVHDPSVLKKIFGSVKEQLSRIPPRPDDAIDVHVVFECKWGKHRSVGLAEIAKRIFGNNGLRIGSGVHLSKGKWSRKKCGWRSCDCNEITNSKQSSLDVAQRVWLEVFGD